MAEVQTIKIGPDFTMKIPFVMNVNREPSQDLFWRIDRFREEGKDSLIQHDIKIFKVEDDMTYMFLVLRANRKKNVEKKCEVVFGNVDYSNPLSQSVEVPTHSVSVVSYKPTCIDDIHEKDTKILKFEVDEDSYSKYFATNDEISSDDYSD